MHPIDELPIEYGAEVYSHTLMARNNCFTMITKDEQLFRVVNVTHENLVDLIENHNLTLPLKLMVLRERVAAVHDERIPHKYYEQRFCEVCCPRDLLPAPQRLYHLRDVATGYRSERPGGTVTFFNGNSREKTTDNE